MANFHIPDDALLWNTNLIWAQVIFIQAHCLHAVVQYKNSDPWLFSRIYASVFVLNHHLICGALASINLSDDL